MAEPIASTRHGPGGHPCDLLQWGQAEAGALSSSSIDSEGTLKSEQRLVILFVPGNPGLVDYYRFFLSTLHAALSPISTTTYALGHLGHTPAHAPRAFRYVALPSLNDQVQHKVDFIDELSQLHDIGSAPGQTRLVLLGHSIGSWITLQVMKARPGLVHAAHLLFPTVSHMKKSPNGARLSPLFGYLRSIAAVATNILSFVPKTVLLPIVKMAANQTGPGAEVTASLLASSGTVVAALFMAGEEMEDVTELDKEVLHKYGDRLTWYWAAGDDDGWVSQTSITEIRDTLREAGHEAEAKAFRCEEGMQHAFVLSSNHSESLARKSASWIRATLSS